MAMKLYYAAVSVCSQKVLIALEERNVNWEGETLNLIAGDQFKPEYLKLNPAAVVPTLIDGGHILTESIVISEYIDEVAQGPRLMPADPVARAETRLWLLRSNEIHASINTMTFSTINRATLLQKSAEELEVRYASMPNPLKAAKLRSLLEQGLDSVYVQAAIRHLDESCAAIDTRVAATGFLAGNAYGLADLGVTPMIARLYSLGMEGFFENRPAMADWFARIQERPSFNAGVRDQLPPGWEEKARKAGGEAWPLVERTLASQ